MFQWSGLSMKGPDSYSSCANQELVRWSRPLGCVFISAIFISLDLWQMVQTTVKRFALGTIHWSEPSEENIAIVVYLM